MDCPVEILYPPEPDEASAAETDPIVVQAQQLNNAAMAVLKDKPVAGVAACLTMLRRAFALMPNAPQIWSNFGLVYWRMGDLADAEDAFHQAVALDPSSSTYAGNLGVFLGSIGKVSEAKRWLDEASRLDPDDTAPVWDLALLHLRQGDWERGLKCYDIRRNRSGPKFYPEFPVPLWRGEDLAGKTLYVQGEQGIGDRFLFSRYIVWIKQTWPTCTIKACLHDSMVDLFWEFRHFMDFLPQGVPWPREIDYGVFLCTLPEIHGTTTSTIPPDPGLLLQRIRLAQDSTKCNMPQPNMPSLKVGVCWTGNPTQVRNLDRSIPLELMLTLAEDPRIVLYGFQCSPGNEDVKRLGAEDLICDISAEIEREGWVHTGLALKEMDLLVSVCTSVPHFAGCIGVPTWVLLCADPYWIWGRDGTTTEWYPGLRLFRQRRLGQWDTVVSEVRDELSKLADEKLNNSQV